MNGPLRITRTGTPMLFNLVKILAVASVALAVPTPSPLLEGPITVSQCKIYNYQDFCCDEIIDNYSPIIDVFGNNSSEDSSLIGFACRPPSTTSPTCSRNGHHLCCTAAALRGFVAFGCQKIIS